MVRWCWVNFQYRGVQLIWSILGQGPMAHAVGADRDCLDIFSLVYNFSLLSLSLCLGDGRYRLKYCLKGLLSPKQPTNHATIQHVTVEELTSIQLVKGTNGLFPIMRMNSATGQKRVNDHWNFLASFFLYYLIYWYNLVMSGHVIICHGKK